ncbi:MAG TPA: glycosyltransferase, partial [Chitinophagales bacterium]|nr:glycosyltransferase [Chitinophagales bacterium]
IVPITERHSTTNPEFICLATLPQDGFPSNEMALEMLQQIAIETYKQNEQIKFYVVGGGKMPVAKSPNIVYTGYVENLRATILQADICLMPFPPDAVCGGARNKFCDYIALGKAVVTTTEGLRGMEVLQDEVNCIVAEDVVTSAAKINALAGNREKLRTIEQGVLQVKGYYNWEERARHVETIFKQLLAI